MTFYTADTHFGHANILKLCNRPFETIEEMNEIKKKNGILFKNAVSLEETGKIQIAVLDKTGTITTGEPEVTDVIGDKELIGIAYRNYLLVADNRH